MQAQMFNLSCWTSETDPHVLRSYFSNLLQSAGFGVLGSIDYHFKPFGYTLLILLSESHFAIHTFPEEGKSYIELSSCIGPQFERFIEKVRIKNFLN